MAEGICIILAYNRDLCEETRCKIKGMGMEEWVICMTFHGLATYCVAPTYDDIALATVLDDMDSGLLEFRPIRNVRAILIDEAQDFRPSFLRLIRHLIHTTAETQYMVVGDPRQMLYDYNEDDPASLEYLSKPQDFFVSRRQWQSVELYVTHRLTPEMACLVNGMFGVRLESPKEPGIPVDVYTIKMWSTGPLVLKLLRGMNVTECVVLVPYKKGNSPLEKMVNALSRCGIRLHVHGLDGQDPRVRQNKLVVSTWHASKGTERRVCIVMGLTQHSDLNPSFVALTRGTERLIVVQDEASPHHDLMKAIQRAPETYTRLDAATRGLLSNIETMPIAPLWQRSRECINVDAWRPAGTGRWVCEMICVSCDGESALQQNEKCSWDGSAAASAACDDAHTEDEIIGDVVGEHEDVAEVYRVACLIAAECKLTCKVRRVVDILTPTRIEREKQAVAIREGCHARFVSPTIPDDVLLASVHRLRVRTLYNATTALAARDWCFLACACRAWNHYQHMLQQLDPFDWMLAQKLEAGIDRIVSAVSGESCVEFDVRLWRQFEGKMLHARCDAVSSSTVYIFSWKPLVTYSDRIEAAVFSALHESKRCAILNLKTGERVNIELKDRDRMLRGLAESPEKNRPRAAVMSNSTPLVH